MALQVLALAQGGLAAGRVILIVVVLTAMTTALTLVIGGMLNAVQLTLPPEFALGVGMMPSNVPACLSALLTASIARWIYDTHARIVLYAA